MEQWQIGLVVLGVAILVMVLLWRMLRGFRPTSSTPSTRPGNSAIASGVYRGGVWVMTEDRSAPGYVPGPPPTRPGEHEGYSVQVISVPTSPGAKRMDDIALLPHFRQDVVHAGNGGNPRRVPSLAAGVRFRATTAMSASTATSATLVAGRRARADARTNPVQAVADLFRGLTSNLRNNHRAPARIGLPG